MVGICFITALVNAMEEAIEAVHSGCHMPASEMHERVKELYTWQDVAERTEKVGGIQHVHYTRVT